MFIMSPGYTKPGGMEGRMHWGTRRKRALPGNRHWGGNGQGCRGAESGEVLIAGRQVHVEHAKSPWEAVQQTLVAMDWDSISGAAVTGRLGNILKLEKIPFKASQTQGLEFMLPGLVPVTVVSISSHGFSVLEIRGNGSTVLRENSRCSQGTGNFLRQWWKGLTLPWKKRAIFVPRFLTRPPSPDVAPSS